MHVQVQNLRGGYKLFKTLIHSSGHPYLKIAKYREYFEARFSGLMKYFNLIHSVYSVSFSSTLSILFTLETKRMGGRGSLRTEGVKATKDLKNLLMAIVQSDLFHQRCD
jgi:hypothetical protein